MILSYIMQPCCIILAITPANSDLAYSDALQMDGIVDPDIGSSLGFEDGEFESSKIIRPAALFYHNEDDSFYFVDSEILKLYGSWICHLVSFKKWSKCEGSSKIIEIYGQLIKEKSSLVKEILPSQQLPQNNFSVEGISRAGLLYSVVTFQDNIVICDTVFLAETLDVVQDIDWVISLGNAFAKQYELYTYDDEHSALLHRAYFGAGLSGVLAWCVRVGRNQPNAPGVLAPSIFTSYVSRVLFNALAVFALREINLSKVTFSTTTFYLSR
ncbi:hypothetical protein Lser_V15G32037 [Lactuca serriola]